MIPCPCDRPDVVICEQWPSQHDFIAPFLVWIACRSCGRESAKVEGFGIIPGHSKDVVRALESWDANRSTKP